MSSDGSLDENQVDFILYEITPKSVARFTGPMVRSSDSTIVGQYDSTIVR